MVYTHVGYSSCVPGLPRYVDLPGAVYMLSFLVEGGFRIMCPRRVRVLLQNQLFSLPKPKYFFLKQTEHKAELESLFSSVSFPLQQYI